MEFEIRTVRYPNTILHVAGNVKDKTKKVIVGYNPALDDEKYYHMQDSATEKVYNRKNTKAAKYAPYNEINLDL